MRATKTNPKRCSTLTVLLCGWAISPRRSDECDRCTMLTDDIMNLIAQSKQPLPKVKEKARETDRFDLVEIDISNKEPYIRKLLVTLRRRLKR